MGDSFNEIFAEHLATVSDRYDQALERSGHDTVIIGAGIEHYRYRDDQAHLFVVNPYLTQWVPLRTHPGSGLIYLPGHKPRLVILRPDDYWHLPAPLPGAPWAEAFDVEVVTSVEAAARIWRDLPGHVARLGDPGQWPADTTNMNPPALVNYLDFHRPYKTRYERLCIGRANVIAAPAHRDVAAAFEAGASEYEMLGQFLNAGQMLLEDLPYRPIIATNRHCATLHYQNYERDSGDFNSLLIDAGYQLNGYAADISRTYGFVHAEFANMVADLDREQQALCDQVRSGIAFGDLHRQAHLAIARLLTTWGIATGDPAELLHSGVTRAFMPHGLGHYLGLQVHELGGLLANQDGEELERPAEFPSLRTVRTLDVDQVLTIEPGIYFIDSLLEDLRGSIHGRMINWSRVAELHKFGGMRIEDNLVVTESGAVNLTRQAFADL